MKQAIHWNRFTTTHRNNHQEERLRITVSALLFIVIGSLFFQFQRRYAVVITIEEQL